MSRKPLSERAKRLLKHAWYNNHCALEVGTDGRSLRGLVARGLILCVGFNPTFGRPLYVLTNDGLKLAWALIKKERQC